MRWGGSFERKGGQFCAFVDAFFASHQASECEELHTKSEPSIKKHFFLLLLPDQNGYLYKDSGDEGEERGWRRILLALLLPRHQRRYNIIYSIFRRIFSSSPNSLTWSSPLVPYDPSLISSFTLTCSSTRLNILSQHGIIIITLHHLTNHASDCVRWLGESGGAKPT